MVQRLLILSFLVYFFCHHCMMTDHKSEIFDFNDYYYYYYEEAQYHNTRVVWHG